MNIPDDIDQAFELFERKAAEVNALMNAVDAEHKAGRTGHASFLVAREATENIKEFAQLLTLRIEEARRSL